MHNWRFFTVLHAEGSKRRWHWQYKDGEVSEGRLDLAECLADARAHGFDQPIVYISDKPSTRPVKRRVCAVVEDNIDAAETMAMILAAEGHDVSVAFDGAEGLSLIHRVRPDVALLDIGLPSLDGYDIARSVRNEPWGDSVTLIACTAYGQPEDKEKSRRAGFNYHLVKPIEWRAVTAILSAVP